MQMPIIIGICKNIDATLCSPVFVASKYEEKILERWVFAMMGLNIDDATKTVKYTSFDDSSKHIIQMNVFNNQVHTREEYISW